MTTTCTPHSDAPPLPPRGAVVVLATRWGDWPVGTRARVLRSWRDPHGCGWVCVTSGRTADGKSITMTYPLAVLMPEEGAAR